MASLNKNDRRKESGSKDSKAGQNDRGAGCHHWNILLEYYSCSVAQSCPTLLWLPWTAARQASLSFTIFWSLLKLMSIEEVMPSNHLILCRPLLLSPSIFPSIRVFSNELALCIRWPNYWSFSLSISQYPMLDPIYFAIMQNQLPTEQWSLSLTR